MPARVKFRMAALRPAGPGRGSVSTMTQSYNERKHSGKGNVPPPMMQTSTSSASRSTLAGSKFSSSSVSAFRDILVVVKVLSGRNTVTAHLGTAGLVEVARQGLTARVGRHRDSERVLRCKLLARGAVEAIASDSYSLSSRVRRWSQWRGKQITARKPR